MPRLWHVCAVLPSRPAQERNQKLIKPRKCRSRNLTATLSANSAAHALARSAAQRTPERWLKSCIREAGSRLLSVLNATAHQKHMRRCCSRDFDEKQSGGRIGAGATAASRTPSEHLLNSLHCFRFDFSVRVHLLQHLARMMQGRHRLRG